MGQALAISYPVWCSAAPGAVCTLHCFDTDIMQAGRISASGLDSCNCSSRSCHRNATSQDAICTAQTCACLACPSGTLQKALVSAPCTCMRLPGPCCRQQLVTSLRATLRHPRRAQQNLPESLRYHSRKQLNCACLPVLQAVALQAASQPPTLRHLRRGQQHPPAPTVQPQRPLSLHPHHRAPAQPGPLLLRQRLLPALRAQLWQSCGEPPSPSHPCSLLSPKTWSRA